jgi:hypothetical protein
MTDAAGLKHPQSCTSPSSCTDASPGGSVILRG